MVFFEFGKFPFKKSPLAGNPQFKVKILEQYQDTVIWILLQKHSATNDYQVFFISLKQIPIIMI